MGTIVVMTQIGVVTTLCLWEIWAFEDSAISRDQKMGLSCMYGPYAVIPAFMVLDMLQRVNRRVETTDRDKLE